MKKELSRSEEARPSIDERTASLMRAEERYREIRVDDSMNPTDPLYFPTAKVPPGWEYRWVRTDILGVPDLDHERHQMRKGWTPVPADRHPEESRNYLHTADIHTQSNIIKRRGLVLCEMPIKTLRELELKEAKKVQSDLDSLGNAIERMPNDPTIPRGILENRDDFSSTTSGRTFGN